MKGVWGGEKMLNPHLPRCLSTSVSHVSLLPPPPPPPWLCVSLPVSVLTSVFTYVAPFLFFTTSLSLSLSFFLSFFLSLSFSLSLSVSLFPPNCRFLFFYLCLHLFLTLSLFSCVFFLSPSVSLTQRKRAYRKNNNSPDAHVQ